MTAAVAVFLALASARSVEPPPLDRLEAHADDARRTVERRTLSQSVGPIETPLSLEAASFLLDHPDLSAWLVRRRKLAPYVIDMRGPGRSWADDGDGTTGFIDLVFKQENRRAYYTEGTHVSAVFPDIRASALVVLDLEPVRREGCPEHLVSSFHVYFKLRSGFLSTMVKALRPFVKGLIVKKFTRAFAVAHQVGVLLAEDPDGVGRELLSYPRLTDADRAALRALLAGRSPAAASCLERR